MVGSNGKLSVGMACCVGAIALAAWAAPSSYADEDPRSTRRAASMEHSAKVGVAATLPVSRIVALSLDLGAANGGKPATLAYRRILGRIAATGNNWAPMSVAPRLVAMTPIAPKSDRRVGQRAAIPASVMEPRYTRTASAY